MPAACCMRLGGRGSEAGRMLHAPGDGAGGRVQPRLGAVREEAARRQEY